MKTKNSFRYHYILSLIVIVGVTLRLWHLSSQLFLDDEWHAFGFVMDRSFLEVVFQHGMGANSIPVNIWFWLTLHTVGWSETILRLPSILAGILALAVLPLLVKRLWGPTVSLVFAALMAISPIVIFYTRVNRPFSPAMFFGTASLLMTLLWIRDGQKRDIFISVIAGFLGIYYHLYTAIPVGFPLIVTAIAACKPVSRHLGLTVQTQKPWKVLWLAAVLMSSLLGIFVILPNVLNPWWMGVQGMSHANWGTLKTFVEFIAGTAKYNLSLFIYFLVPLGSIVLLLRNRSQGVVFITPLIAFVAVIANYTQDGAHAGIQAARYGIVFFPMCFILIALAVEYLISKLQQTIPALKNEIFAPLFFVFCWSPLIANSPLWDIYRFPNNFTNHSAFQYDYTPFSWSKSPERSLAPGISVKYDEIPLFYRQPNLYSDCKGIIEYPMAIGDHFNILYYYQHYHKLPVVCGYTRRDTKNTDPPRGEWVFASNTIDYVLTRVPQHLMHKTNSWYTMINLDDMEYLRSKFTGWFIILHKNPIRETTEHISEFGQTWYKSPDLPETTLAANNLFSQFGVPIMESNHIMVWRVK